MKYPYMTILSNNTEITHGDMREDGSVVVYVETPDEKDGFHNATCILPSHTWKDINGYTSAEMEYYQQLIKDNAHLIMESSQKGGFLNASNL